MKKEYIIVLVLAIGALAYYFLVLKKKTDALETAKTADPFEADDTLAYNGAKSLFKAGDLAWMNDGITSLYTSASDPAIMINGRPSKTLALIAFAGTQNKNPEGLATDRDGDKALWPQSTFDTLWSKYRAPLVAKYGGL